VFVIALPLALVALVLAIRVVPAHVNEATDPVDNLGGILSVLLVAGLVLSTSPARRTSPSSIRSTATRSSRARKSRSSTAPTGRTPRGSWRSSSGRLVYFLFPKRQEEEELLARYQADDSGEAVGPADAPDAPSAVPA
jgi:hypothetical protein